jgi:site-specific DNA recombinase
MYDIAAFEKGIKSMSNMREERRRRFQADLDAHEVTVIPAKEEYLVDIREKDELVGAYCRVSTMSDEQVESYDLQRKEYEDKVAQNDHWTLVDVYADEGISATSTKKRKDFNRLIEDCKAGKVSLILTKSVTRFARNTVDCVSTCRMLKNLDPPVGVLFETDGLHTLAANSELQLNLLSTLAQSESETKSLAVKWGIRRRFARGIPRIVDLYGYHRDGRDLIENPEQSAVVRMIFQWVLMRYSVSEIKELLRMYKIPSPHGRDTWSYSTINFKVYQSDRPGTVFYLASYGFCRPRLCGFEIRGSQYSKTPHGARSSNG